VLTRNLQMSHRGQANHRRASHIALCFFERHIIALYFTTSANRLIIRTELFFLFHACHHHSLIRTLEVVSPPMRDKSKVFRDRIDMGTYDCHSLVPQTFINQHSALRTRNRRASASQEPLTQSQQTPNPSAHAPLTVYSSEYVCPCFRYDPSFAWPWRTVITPDHSDLPP
jgi:hypothetical protein